jgi:hypothetical protein
MIEYRPMRPEQRAENQIWRQLADSVIGGSPGLLGHFAATWSNPDLQLCELHWAFMDD